MNLILLFPSDLIADASKVVLRGRRHAHVRDVHRKGAGDRLVVGMAGGRIGEGKIARLTSQEIEMDVAFFSEPPLKLPVVLCLALMRPIVFKRALQTAVTMGVEAVHVFHSRRVEKSFWQSTALGEGEVREQIILGLEQARDTVLPPVSFHKRFKPFAEDILPELLQGRQGIVADPSGSPCMPPSPVAKVLVIGPEGGFIPYELEKFREAGCSVLGLGPRILRVETAIPALLSRLS